MNSFPNITHHGAINGVTGSCHQLHIDDHNSILVDCGLFQGAETSGRADRNNKKINFPIKTVRALVLTHVHIDHCGRVPFLLAAGFKGPIFCSRPSAILLPLVIEDALKVGVTKNRNLINRVIEQLKQQIKPLEYKQWHKVDTTKGTQLDVRLQRAGHILGSAYVECRSLVASNSSVISPMRRNSHVVSTAAASQERRSGETYTSHVISTEAAQSAAKRRNLDHITVFSGDLGAPHTPLLPSPKSPHRADTLVIESTYGDRTHEDRKTRQARLQTIIQKAMRDRGTVLIPAFSIGRTQELLYELEDIIHRHRKKPVAKNLPWEELEIVVDSPLANKFTEVYKKLRPYWDDEAKKRLRAGRHPLSFEQLRTVEHHQDHMKLVRHLEKSDYPCIVLAASGMCAGGRIVNYLKALIDKPETDVLFVGYQAAGTPGRDIQNYGPKGGWVELDQQRYDIKAGIHTVSGYSAHADQADLVRFTTGIRRAPSQVRIVHGDEDAKRHLESLLNQKLTGCSVTVP